MLWVGCISKGSPVYVGCISRGTASPLLAPPELLASVAARSCAASKASCRALLPVLLGDLTSLLDGGNVGDLQSLLGGGNGGGGADDGGEGGGVGCALGLKLGSAKSKSGQSMGVDGMPRVATPLPRTNSRLCEAAGRITSCSTRSPSRAVPSTATTRSPSRSRPLRAAAPPGVSSVITLDLLRPIPKPLAQPDSCTSVPSALLREWDEPLGAGAVGVTEVRGLCIPTHPVGDTLQVPLLEGGDAPPGNGLSGGLCGEARSSGPNCTNFVRLCAVPSAPSFAAC